ncbi:MAG TPA: hypothetical protein VF039_05835 [Longimicrobiales bacterium]
MRGRRASGLGRRLRVALVDAIALAGLLAGLGVLPATAQAPDPRAEMERLRTAQQAEAMGDIAAAESILSTMLRERPSSLSALLSLDRLLRAQGRDGDALAHIERFLEVDPRSPIGHQLALRALSTMDRVDDLERAERRWIEATPGLETPYREAARVWEQREDYERALRVLREGRQRLGGDALAWELGSVYALQNDARRAIDEWSRAIGDDADRMHLVQRRLAALPDGGGAITPGLIARLRAAPTTVQRLRAALVLAVEAGLEAEATALAQQVYAQLADDARAEFLLTTGRDADASRQPRLAYWAYRALLQLTPDGEQTDAVRRRVGELALAVGDTATAREAAIAMEARAEPGSVLARQAEARRIELSATPASLDAAIAAYTTFRAQHPDAAEVGRLAGVIGTLALRAGRLDDAAAIVEGVRGAGAAHVRARVALHNGDPDEARAAFQAAAAGLVGREATDVIAYATLLARATPDGARRLGSALDRLDARDVDGALDALTEPGLELRAAERSGMLDMAARIADAEGQGVRAESIRRALIDEHPRAQEAPAALLGLARALAARPDGATEASALLERLILEHPRSALVPQARRLVAEISRVDGRR